MPRPRISNLQVTGSNPVGRASFNKKTPPCVVFFIKTCVNTGIKTLGSSHRRKGDHRAKANMGIYNPVERVPEIQATVQVVLIFVCVLLENNSLFFIIFVVNCKSNPRDWVRGCHKPAIVGAKYLMASLSDVIPVVLCRYLSLTLISRGAVCYITGETRKQQNQYYSDL